MLTYDELQAIIHDYKGCMGLAHMHLASELFRLSDSIEDRYIRLKIQIILDHYTDQVGSINKMLDKKLFQLDK